MSDSAFAKFLQLSLGFASKAKPLPVPGEEVVTQAFVYFSVLNQDVVVAVEELAEVLELQAYTRLPRVKKWVRGVSNVRGRLLPVVDFAEFLDGRLSTSAKQQRILVLEAGSIYVGLLVDQVFGMRHLRVDRYTQSVSDVPEVLLPYLDGAFVQDGKRWLLMRPPKLAADPIFMDVAA